MKMDSCLNSPSLPTAPVALIIFNRPETTMRVFSAIRQARPSRLFVIADGPRTTEEGLRCAAARAETETVDWPCKVQRNYSEVNLGNRGRTFSGLDWLFSHTDRAIILEDDCLPNQSFFRYCTELLERHAQNEKVFNISGVNHLSPSPPYPTSYWFSPIAEIWGFATWARAWKQVDPKMSEWERRRETTWLTEKIGDADIAEFYARKFDKYYFDAYHGRTGWSFAYRYSMLTADAYDARPAVNMITNIGHGAGATNTKTDSPWANFPLAAMEFPLRHPLRIEPDISRERLLFQQYDPAFRPWRLALKHLGILALWQKIRARISAIKS